MQKLAQFDAKAVASLHAVKIVAFQDVDFAVRHAQAFAAIKDITIGTITA